MRWALRIAASACLSLVAACDATATEPAAAPVLPAPMRAEPLEPLPARLPVPAHRAALGEQLFQDPALSSGGQIACVTCHPFDHGGADLARTSATTSGGATRFNTPSIFNVALNFRFSWLGAFDTIEAQLDEAFVRTMGVDIPGVVARLVPRYGTAFQAAYPGEGLTARSLRDALSVYVTSLVTPDAPFDRYLRGDASALSADARAGYALFKDLGCASCHQGANVGGNLFQRMGTVEDYFATRGQPVTEADLGRFVITHAPEDRHVFRVPSLRNVERTAPYFHDGSAATLDDAIATMARFQLGRDVPPEDRARIAAFLRTLTGTYRGRPL